LEASRRSGWWRSAGHAGGRLMNPRVCRLKAEARSRRAWTRSCVTSTSTRRQPYPASATPGLHVGPFFLIVALTVSIVAFLLLRGQPLAALTLVALTLIGAGLTAAAMYRTIAPLGSELPDDTSLVGGRTRAALERDKALTLRALKELEFDRAMGKVSDADFAEMRDRLRARAVRLMTQLDGTAMYRAQIERDVAEAGASGVSKTGGASEAGGGCSACGTANDADARFCKSCGAQLVAA